MAGHDKKTKKSGMKIYSNLHPKPVSMESMFIKTSFKWQRLMDSISA